MSGKGTVKEVVILVVRDCVNYIVLFGLATLQLILVVRDFPSSY
jgi:hypothetical protein